MGRQNLLLWSRDVSFSPWTGGTTTTPHMEIGVKGSLSAAKLEHAIAAQDFRSQIVTKALAINDVVQFGISLKLTGALQGNGRIDIRVEGNGGVAEGTTVAVTATDTLTEYTVSHTFSNAQSGYKIRLTNVSTGVDEIIVDQPHTNIGAALDAYIETTTTAQNRYFEETFQGNLGPQSGYDNVGWVEVGTVDPNALTSDVKNPPNWREKSLRVASPGSTTAINIPGRSKLYCRMEFVPVSFSGSFANIVVMRASDFTNLFFMQQVSGNYILTIPANNPSLINANLGFLNNGQRYRLEVLYDIPGLIWVVWLDGKSISSGTLLSPPASTGTLFLGNGQAGLQDIYYNLIAFDDTARIHNETDDVGPDGTGPTGRTRGTHEVIDTIGDVLTQTVDYDFNQMSVWESSLPVNTTVTDETRVLEVRDDKTIDNGAGVTLIGTVTDRHRPIIVRTLHESQPVMTSTGRTVQIFTHNTFCQDFTILDVGNSAVNLYTFLLRGNNDIGIGLNILNSINNGAGSMFGVWVDVATTSIFLVDTIISGVVGVSLNLQTSTLVLSNVTIFGDSNTGIRRDSGALIAKNCGSFGAATNWSGVFDSASTNNASTDGTHPGLNGRTGSPLFVDSANGDLNLLETDDLIAYHGADLSQDLNFPINYDINMKKIGIHPIGADSIATGQGQRVQRVRGTLADIQASLASLTYLQAGQLADTLTLTGTDDQSGVAVPAVANINMLAGLGLTRIAGYLSGIGRRLTITAKTAAGGPLIIPVSLSFGANARTNTLHTASFSQTTGITAQSGMGPSNIASAQHDSNLLASLTHSSNSTAIKTALSALRAQASTSGGVSAFAGRVVDLGATSTQVFNLTALAAQVTSLPASAFLSSTPQSTLDVLMALQAQATASSFSTILFQAVQQFAATSGLSLTAQQVIGVLNAVTSLSISGNMSESVSATVQATIQEAVTANLSPQVLSIFQAVASLPVSASQAFLAATVSHVILASLGLGAKTGLSQGLDMASLVQSVLQTQAGMTEQSTFNASGLVAFPTAAHQAVTAALVSMIFSVLVDLGATTDISFNTTQQAVAATALGLKTELSAVVSGLHTTFLGLGFTAQQSFDTQRVFLSMLTIALSSSLATGATVTTLQIGPVLKFLSEQLLTPGIVNETLE